jgi:glycosyltransferase involved in cell wall biosynthesis
MTSFGGTNPLPELLSGRLETLGYEVWRRSLRELGEASLPSDRRVVVLFHWIGYLFRRSKAGSIVAVLRFLLLLTFLRMRRIGVVWVLHNDESHDVEQPQLERVFQSIFVRYYVDRVIVMTPEGFDVLDQMAGKAGRSKGRLVPHPTYETAFGPAPTELPREPGTVQFLFFGRIQPYKGVLELLDAFSTIEHPRARLSVVGRYTDEGLAAEIRRRAARDKRVTVVLGKVEADDVSTWVAGADWVVLPYRRILNSGVALLAVTYRIPVIAPAIGGLPSSLRSEGRVAGILYEPGEGALTDALRAALVVTPTERAAMVDASARLAVEASIEAVGARLSAVFDELALPGSHRVR